MVVAFGAYSPDKIVISSIVSLLKCKTLRLLNTVADVLGGSEKAIWTLLSNDAVVLISNDVTGLYLGGIILESKLGLLLTEAVPATLTLANFNEIPVDDPVCAKTFTVILFPAFTVAVAKLGG